MDPYAKSFLLEVMPEMRAGFGRLRGRLSLWRVLIRRGCGIAAVAMYLACLGSVWSLPSVEAKEPTAEDIARCEREKAAREAWWEDTYRRTHPGHVGPIPPNPVPYVCGPVPDDPPAVPSGPEEGDDAPTRVHRYEGFDTQVNPYEQDMQVGSPRRGLAERVTRHGEEAHTRSGPAESNVPEVVPWEISLPDRVVRVVDAGEGEVAVIDNEGAATGEIIVRDPVTGEERVDTRDGLVGEQLVNPEERDSPARDGEVSVNAGREENSSHEAHGSTDLQKSGTDALPIGPVGAAGAVAGVMVVLRRRNRVWRRNIQWGGGRDQSLVVLEGPDSPRQHRFNMDVPNGGRLIKDADGGVSVVNGQGEIVEWVRPPWAYDISGRVVPTWFEVDNTTGEIIQVIDPEQSTVLPVVADPDKTKTAGEESSGKNSLWQKTKSLAGKGWEKTKSVARAGKNKITGWESGQREEYKRKGERQREEYRHSRNAPNGVYLGPVSGTGKPNRKAHGAASTPSGTIAQLPTNRNKYYDPDIDDGLDTTLPTRQPGFIGPVTLEDAAGQARNRARRNVKVDPGNMNDPRFPGDSYQGDDAYSRSVREIESKGPRAKNPNVVPPSVGASDVGMFIQGAGTDAGFSAAEYSARGLEGVGDLAQVARVGSRAFGAGGALLGAEIDRRQGMDAKEAYISNMGGGMVGAATVAAVTAFLPVTLPVWGVGLLIVGGGAVTLGATKGIQYLYENAMSDECK